MLSGCRTSPGRGASLRSGRAGRVLRRLEGLQRCVQDPSSLSLPLQANLGMLLLWGGQQSACSQRVLKQFETTPAGVGYEHARVRSGWKARGGGAGGAGERRGRSLGHRPDTPRPSPAKDHHQLSFLSTNRHHPAETAKTNPHQGPTQQPQKNRILVNRRV